MSHPWASPIAAWIVNSQKIPDPPSQLMSSKGVIERVTRAGMGTSWFHRNPRSERAAAHGGRDKKPPARKASSPPSRVREGCFRS